RLPFYYTLITAVRFSIPEPTLDELIAIALDAKVLANAETILEAKMLSVPD
ncbi:hypothetical protein Tco_0572125, partial [Tanacetum coccineum]